MGRNLQFHNRHGNIQLFYYQNKRGRNNKTGHNAKDYGPCQLHSGNKRTIYAATAISKFLSMKHMARFLLSPLIHGSTIKKPGA